MTIEISKTKKVFWQDPYLTQLDTHITGVYDNDITVAETIFYAFSGGQESDVGTIGNHPVIRATKNDLDILYTLDAGHGLQVGDAVKIEIDWGRRYQLMRLHFAAEIILELAYQTLAGVPKIGAHIAQDKARIDFDWPENLSPRLPEFKARAQAIINADYPIISAFSDEATQRRYWKIEGFAEVPCGGTHLKKTGEVGQLELKRKNVGKGKERIEIYVIA